MTMIEGARPAVSVVELIGLVDGLHGFVADRMRGYRSEVDATMQRIRETVWRCGHRFDPALGRSEDFVFGIARNVVRREIARHGRRPVEASFTDIQLQSAASGPDPLESLMASFEACRWVRVLADSVTEIEWQVVIELSVTDVSHAEVAARCRISERTVRAIRLRVAQVAQTVRRALILTDEGLDRVGQDELVWCLPESSGCRDILPWLDIDPAVAASSLGVTTGSFRNMRAHTQRLMSVAERIVSGEVV